MSLLKGEVKRVADHIMVRILDGRYPCGLRLPSETALGKQLSVGRSTVREALGHLSSMGLVRSRRGSGAMVLDYRREGTPALLPAFVRAGQFEAPPDRIALELLRMRRTMAAEAVRLAATYASADRLTQAKALLAHSLTLIDDPAAHTLNELEIYRELVVASGMWPVAWMVNAFWGPLREINATFAAALGPVPTDFHSTLTTLFEHIDNHRANAAVALVHSWFERVDRRLVRLIQRMFYSPSKAASSS
ncbi:MAG TPA: FadR family transcriptional regulator [Sorangium sp.]|nr:FadR family transcriptional regulator [Sorangium sp.]